MSIDITPATLDDLPALSALLTALFTQEAEFRPDEAAQRRGLARIIGSADTGLIVVARQAGRVVGMVTLLFTVSTALGERVAWLEDMVVDAGCRGQGVGALLIDGAIALARAHGCRRITLLTDADNLMAHRFYERHGFRASSMVPLRLHLD
ncbi:GNAT family N-acetyltransferase [Aquabacterium sp.]|uniref:GNAT family N-acetyltransferase n=1 Tax=Aquabacterium sp. TaxID=1872578 RepID=UPI003D6CD13F